MVGKKTSEIERPGDNRPLTNWREYSDDLREQLGRLTEAVGKSNNCDQALFSEMSQRLSELLRAGRTKEIAGMIKENIVGVLIIGSGPVLQYSNSRAREILGPDALIKTELTSESQVFYMADQVTLSGSHLPWLRALQGHNVDEDLLFMQPDIGSGDKWLKVCAMPQKSREDDSIVATIVLVIDVTESVQNEHRLRQIKQALLEAEAAAKLETENKSEAQPHDSAPLALIADDLLLSRILLACQLRQEGYAVHLSCNGKEAVEAASRQKYDLILMDTDMPLMDGYAAMRAIRAAEKQDDGETLHVPIVALTPQVRRSEGEKCLAAGADEYMAKTSHREILRHVIAVLTGKPRDGGSDSSVKEPQSIPDMQVLEQIYEGADLKSLLDLFVISTRLLLDNIQEALARRDMRAVHHYAFYLKGPAALLSAGKMARLCGEIAESAIRGKWFDADDHFAELTSAFRAFGKAVPSGTTGDDKKSAGQDLVITQTLTIDMLEQKVGRRQAENRARSFVQEAGTTMDAIAAAIKKYDFEALYPQAKNLSAACATFFIAKELRTLSKQLEIACDEMHVDWIEVAVLFDRMSRSYKDIEVQVSEYLEKSTSSV
ncbi:MAG: response regulator [Cyanobacteria bacterium SZAS LIN-2]|nr:response regulator [Cyanobacteria bacterium SZAS LIN-2]